MVPRRKSLLILSCYRIRPETLSLHASYKGILHFVPRTKLADDGGGSMACFFEACSSKIIARETVKKKRGVGGGATSRVDGERPRVWVGSDLA